MRLKTHLSLAIKQQGAALLVAMLTLTLVATLAAGAAAQQWRSVETERAERARGQAAWLQLGALDWTRIILRQDARSGGADHLGEPWATPLQESRLSSFLAADANSAALLADQAIDNVFLSGQVQDLQAKLNVYHLTQPQVSAASLAAFVKLFDLLGLDPIELVEMNDNLRLSSTTAPTDPAGASVGLLPQSLDELPLMGLSQATLERLRPFVVWLPQLMKVNINTASAEVLYASVPGLDVSGARKVVDGRLKQVKFHYQTLPDVASVVPALAGQFTSGDHSTVTEFFEVTSKLRFADGERSTVMIERALVERKGLNLKLLSRERGSFPVVEGGKTVQEITGAFRQ